MAALSHIYTPTLTGRCVLILASPLFSFHSSGDLTSAAAADDDDDAVDNDVIIADDVSRSWTVIDYCSSNSIITTRLKRPTEKLALFF